MSEYPKVIELEGTFRVEYGTIGTSNVIYHAHEGTLRDLLNKRHEERQAKRWVAVEDPNNAACYLVRQGIDGPTAVRFWKSTCPEAFPLASQLAHQLNQLEVQE